MRYFTLLLASIATTFPVSAFTIKIDYTYDTSNFFDTEEKRNAIEAVAKFYSDMIEDHFLAIDPSEFENSTWKVNIIHPSEYTQEGNTLYTKLVEIQDLVIPEDTIIVFVGARNLSGNTTGQGGPGGFSSYGVNEWNERIQTRGVNRPADHVIWGGMITFDTPHEWNFSQTENRQGTEFISTALHEMAHVLGIGTSDAWDNLVENSTFTGTATIHSHGTAPQVTEDKGHFYGNLDSSSYGSFGSSHGTNTPVLMLPSQTDYNYNYNVVTDLDLAALSDIGWNIVPTRDFSESNLSPENLYLEWKSVSFFNYDLEASKDMETFSSLTGNVAGNGQNQSWNGSQTSPFFLRLNVTKSFENTPLRATGFQTLESKKGQYSAIVVPPRIISCNERGNEQ